MWNLFLTSNESKWRMARTIFQGILGVFIANADYIISSLDFEPTTKTIIVGLVMAILSPLMKSLGTDSDLREEDEVE